MKPDSRSRFPETDRPDPRVPPALAVTIPLTRALAGSPVTLGVDDLHHLKLYQLSTEDTKPIPKYVGILARLCLVRQTRKCDPYFVGYRLVLVLGDLSGPE